MTYEKHGLLGGVAFSAEMKGSNLLYCLECDPDEDGDYPAYEGREAFLAHALDEHDSGPGSTEDEEGEDEETSLGVTFASPQAESAAAGLSPSDFAGKTGSGEDGAFVKADVTEIIEEKE